MSNYVLAPAYVMVQFWNGDKSDLTEVRREPNQDVVPVEGISAEEAKRLLDLGAIVEEGKAAKAEPCTGVVEEPAGNAKREEWVKYADSLGLTVEPNSSREAIRNLIDDARS